MDRNPDPTADLPSGQGRRHFCGRLAGTLPALATPFAPLRPAAAAEPARTDTRIGVRPEPGVTPTTLLIGQSAPLSGPAAELGTQLNLGARLCFDNVNRHGGIFGRAIELHALDDAYVPDETTRNTRKLLVDGMFALFGYVGTSTTLAVLPLIQQARIPLFAPFTGTRALRTPVNRHVFHVRAGYDRETAAIVRQIASSGLHRLAVVYYDDSYGREGLEGIARAVRSRPAADVRITGEHAVARNAVDVSATAAAVLEQHPDSVAVIGAYGTAAAFIREALRRGYAGQFYCLSSVGATSLAKALGAQAAGVVVSQVMPNPRNATLPLVREYQRLLAAAGHAGAYSHASLEGFIAALAFVEGLRRTGRDPTRDRFIAALESMRAIDLGGFDIQFSPEDHVGSKFVDLAVLNARGQAIR
ncbi:MULTISPECIES: ABC transporter substrate-binding protein [unclassified Cupriavidus]|uniref:ABC transporter substrate-binding protein n=1 Tax=unclassified Cupriavidus TaxID=2640874 RepID=UPI00313F2AB0